MSLSQTGIPAMMTAIEIREPGGPEVLAPVQLPVPHVKPGEVLIRVAAAGVNRPDVLQRKGFYPPPPGAPDIPGLEVAGEIVAVGDDLARAAATRGTATESLYVGSAAAALAASAARAASAVDSTNEPASFLRIGAKVCALVAGGGYAQYVAAPAAQCLPIPGALPIEEAGAIPETFFTVYYNVFMRAGLKPGETLLVHGGSSGIGTTAIMLGKAFDAKVIVTAGSAEKCQACLELGADHAINYREEEFPAAVKQFTHDRGADVILDMVGGDYIGKDIAAAAVEGRISVIATQGGEKAELSLRAMMAKRIRITGATLRPQTIEAKGRIASALREQVWPLFLTKRLRPLIHSRFPLEAASRAHELMESNRHIGKIILLC
jgi:NADPH2:quinone reductase